MIALVDYGMGNLRSVEKALARVRRCAHRQRPQVGAGGGCTGAGPALERSAIAWPTWKKIGLVDAIREFVATKRPFLGICLGFQALFESSEEAPGVEGFALFPGTVPRFAVNGLKVPHMGWNELRIQEGGCPLLKDVADGSYVYFVHSYYCKPKDASVVCGTTNYGIEFCSMLWAGNVFATQFHPEKSQAVGLKMLENFVRLGKGGL